LYKDEVKKRNEKDALEFNEMLKFNELQKQSLKQSKNDDYQRFILEELDIAQRLSKDNQFLSDHIMMRKDTGLFPPLSYVPMDLYNSLQAWGNEN